MGTQTATLTTALPLVWIGPRHTVEVSRQELVFRVETRSGSVVGQLVEDLSASFATAEAAKLVARALAESLRSGATIGQARIAVVEACRFASATLAAAPSVDGAYAEDLQRAIGIFQSTEDAQAADDIAARLVADFETRQRDLWVLAQRKSDELAQVLSGDRCGWANLRRAHFDAARRDREAVAS